MKRRIVKLVPDGLPLEPPEPPFELGDMTDAGAPWELTRRALALVSLPRARVRGHYYGPARVHAPAADDPEHAVGGERGNMNKWSGRNRADGRIVDYRRKARVGAHGDTIDTRRTGAARRDSLAVGAALAYDRPATRAECERGGGGPFAHRPCPFVACEHHLYLSLSSAGEAIQVRSAGDVADALRAMRWTCGADVADEVRALAQAPERTEKRGKKTRGRLERQRRGEEGPELLVSLALGITRQGTNRILTAAKDRLRGRARAVGLE